MGCNLDKGKTWKQKPIPFQIIIGSKSEENKFEFKELNSESEMLSLESIKSKLKR